jgi:hypothetical protein
MDIAQARATKGNQGGASRNYGEGDSFDHVTYGKHV